MKKTMKIMLALMAGALAFSACSNDDAIVNAIDNENTAEKQVTLIATIEGQDGVTRAYLDGLDIKWNEGDQIAVFRKTYDSPRVFTLDKGAETTIGCFKGSISQLYDLDAYILYPNQSNASNNNGKLTAEVPYTQTAVKNGADRNAMLMVGKTRGIMSGYIGAPDGWYLPIEFKNVMSYVRVTVPEGMSCKQIVVKAKDEWITLAGKVQIVASECADWDSETELSDIWRDTADGEGQAFVRLVPPSGESAITAGTYYVAVLPQAMTTGFEIIYNVDDVVYNKQTAKQTDVQKKFLRGKVKDIGTLSIDDSYYTYKIGTSSLNLTGITMADRNIGANNPNDYGDYFSQGALRPGYKNKDLIPSGAIFANLYWSNGFKAVSTSADIANQLWGGSWRMPTATEFDNNKAVLKAKMPMAGYCSGKSPIGVNEAWYWSSNSGKCYLNSETYNSDGTYTGENKVTDLGRSHGLSVRPVKTK